MEWKVHPGTQTPVAEQGQGPPRASYHTTWAPTCPHGFGRPAAQLLPPGEAKRGSVVNPLFLSDRSSFPGDLV